MFEDDLTYVEERGIFAVRILIFIEIIFLLLCMTYISVNSYLYYMYPEDTAVEAVVFNRIKDKPHTYEFDPEKDLSLLELPSGSPATASSTLLRIYGIPVTKLEVESVMPKDDVDFIHSFRGDPKSAFGQGCLCPCVADTLNRFAPSDRGHFQAHDSVAGNEYELDNLPIPSIVWITKQLEDTDVIDSINGYSLYENMHCVTVIGIDGGVVHTIDPTYGEQAYPYDQFNLLYKKLGSQSVNFVEG